MKSCKCAFSLWDKKIVQEIIAQNDVRTLFLFKVNSLFDGLTDICGYFACIFLAFPCFSLLPHIIIMIIIIILMVIITIITIMSDFT